MTSTRTLAAAGATIAVVPEVGAKIVSLRRDDGAEWLSAPARPLVPPGPAPRPWSAYDCSGWDECFPNIAPDEASGLADHGTAWSASWSTSEEEGRLKATYLARDGTRLTRWLALAPVGDESDVVCVTADYELTAPATGLDGWAWAQHALLAASPETRIELPEPARVRVEAAFDRGKLVDEVGWLCSDGVLAADTSLAVASGRAAKVWFERPLPPWVTVVAGDEWISWRLDRSSVPDLGLWVNLGGWSAGTGSPLAHVAVEPAYGAHDSFAEAQVSGAGPALAPEESHGWQVVTHLGRLSK